MPSCVPSCSELLCQISDGAIFYRTGYFQVVEELVGAAVQGTYIYRLQRINLDQLVNGALATACIAVPNA